jgi:hypothetical protein
VHVFVPEEEKYPDAAYEQGAGVTQLLLKGRGAAAMDIDDPKLATTYYQELYSLGRPQDRKKDLTEAIKRQDFVDVASLYRLIPKDAINVLVPHDLDTYAELADEVRKATLNSRWILKARAHSVSLFRPKLDAPIQGYLEAVPLAKGEMADDWFIYLKPQHYHRDVGLMPPESMECLIA